MSKRMYTMKYDFTTVIDRRKKDSIASDAIDFAGSLSSEVIKSGFDAIPMWIADMSFKTAPSVTKAINERLAHPIFGYFKPSEEYYRSIIDWQKNHNGVNDLLPEHIGYENGVLGGLISAVNVFTEKGGNILLHSPTYVGFTGSLTNNGYKLIHSPLLRDNDGIYRMDFEDMEKKIIENNIHTAVFCSPHNPTGRVWEKWEIEHAMELFKKHDVFVISDEIWSDLTLFKKRHIPTQSVSEDAKNRTVALYAPSKTFNLAGLIGSYHIIYNKYIRDRVEKQSSLCHYNDMNVLSMHGLIGAYSSDGEEWLEELRETLSGNIDLAYSYIKENFDGVDLMRPEGTYMLFIDCTEWCKVHGISIDELYQKGLSVGVIWQNGTAFNGSCHIRMNLALPRHSLEEALHRLDKYVFNDRVGGSPLVEKPTSHTTVRTGRYTAVQS